MKGHTYSSLLSATRLSALLTRGLRPHVTMGLPLSEKRPRLIDLWYQHDSIQVPSKLQEKVEFLVG